MPFQLFIAEPDSHLRTVWQAVFEAVAGVIVVDATIRGAVSQYGLDAEFMLALLAHDRYGGKHTVGKSAILSTHSETGMPSWVVTTAPFAAHLEERRQPDGSVQMVVVANQPLAPPDETYIVFTKAFEAIVQFNQRTPSSPIHSFGFEPELLNLRGDVHEEAVAVHRAYLEYTVALNGNQ
jgi:hypothetical protein